MSAAAARMFRKFRRQDLRTEPSIENSCHDENRFIEDGRSHPSSRGLLLD